MLNFIFIRYNMHASPFNKMQQSPRLSYEILSEDELHFLEQKKNKQQQIFKKITRICLLIQLIFPFLVSTQYPNYVDEISSIELFYFFSALLTVCILALTMFGTYMYLLYNLKKDLNHKTKRIEHCVIQSKKRMPLNGSVYFYINSPTKISIEANLHDFDMLEIGDEINLEFAQFSDEYYGYY
ncbi:MAG: hypothetical protein KA198_05235 [Chitinophagaceae bacterium]|nr:hypothetical protein [Chitinophagaceae bacterium]